MVAYLDLKIETVYGYPIHFLVCSIRLVPQEKLGIAPTIKIKLVVDKKPPMGFTTEEQLLIKHFSFHVKCFVFSDMFAGKMPTLLFRRWKNNVKGRDWYAIG